MVGTGAVYERLGKNIPSRAIYVQDNDESSTSKSDRTSHIYISGSDSDSSVDLPSFLPMQRAFQSSSGASSCNSAPILQANQSSSGSTSSLNCAPIQAVHSSSGATFSHASSIVSAPVVQAATSSHNSAEANLSSSSGYLLVHL